MIVHCSQKLAAKLAGVSPAPLAETSPLGSWHAHLVTLDRRQCILFCHDETRYTLFAAGLRKEHFADLGGSCFRPLFFATLAALGCSAAQLCKVELALGPLRFDTATDRSVMGSLRVTAWDLEVWLHYTDEVMGRLDPVALSCKLNSRPVTARGKLLWPGDAMREAVGQL